MQKASITITLDENQICQIQTQGSAMEVSFMTMSLNMLVHKVVAGEAPSFTAKDPHLEKIEKKKN